jgi:phage shock protein A
LAGVRLSIESREKRIENLRTQLNAVKAKEKSLEQRQLLQRRANPSQMMGHGDNDSKKLDAQHRDLEQKIAALELEIFDIKQRYKMDVLKTKK